MDRWHEQFERALASHERYWLDPDTYYKDCEEEEEEEIPTCSKCGGYNDNDELGGSWCSKCERERALFVKRKVNEALREGVGLGWVLDQIYTEGELVLYLSSYLARRKNVYEQVVDSVRRIDEWEKEREERRKANGIHS